MKKHKLTRRQFVTTISAGAGTVLLGKVALAIPAKSPGSSADPFQIITLGKSGVKSTLFRNGNRIQWL